MASSAIYNSMEKNKILMNQFNKSVKSHTQKTTKYYLKEFET